MAQVDYDHPFKAANVLRVQVEYGAADRAADYGADYG